ncbi:MAG: branched-chain amino acid aminotransferase [Pseudomonadota bacterium]
MSEQRLRIRKVTREKARRKPRNEEKLGFGKFFSNHMFLMNYDTEKGWHKPRIEPYHKIVLDPAAMVLHYGQEVFEGLKAFSGEDRSIYLFRAKDNLKRFNRSSDRLCIPQIDVEQVYDYLKRLLLIDKKWVPKAPGTSLYIRPNVIATDPFLGVRPSDTYLFYIMTGPVGAYYPEGFNPISIYVSLDYVRAVRGGTGEAKTSGNYAASLAGQAEAKKLGFTQVLWLDAIERKYVEEVGTMNIFFVVGDEIVTAPLMGTILPGITRDSVISICRHWGMKVSERPLGIDEIIRGVQAGTVKEVFGTGTAAVISPVGTIHFKGSDYAVAGGKTGKLSTRLFDYLTGLQYGKLKDPFGWVDKVL